METSFHRLCVCFQVILAYESIVLCMCSGNVVMYLLDNPFNFDSIKNSFWFHVVNGI